MKYREQIKTCAKCHQSQLTCPGKGLARDCSAERVLLSDHMRTHWAEINYMPNTSDMNEVDTSTDDELKKISALETKKTKVSFKEPDPDILKKCTGVVIPGVKKDSDIESLVKLLKECGLPDEYTQEDLLFKESRKSKTVYIHDLSPENSIKLVKNTQETEFEGKTLSVFTLVEELQVKKSPLIRTQCHLVGHLRGQIQNFGEIKRVQKAAVMKAMVKMRMI